MPLDLADLTFGDVVEETGAGVAEEEAPNQPTNEDSQQQPQTPNQQQSQEPTLQDVQDQEEEEPDTENEEEDEEETEEEAATRSLVTDIREAYGFEELQERDYPDTEEGLRALSRDAAEVMAGKSLDQLFKQFPHVQTFLEFRQNGGDPDEYFQTMYPQNDYGEMEVDEGNISQQRRLVEEDLRVRGLSEEQIQNRVDRYEAHGILEDEAKDALDALRSHQQDEQERLIKEQEEKAEARKEEIQKFWTGFRKRLNETSQVGGIPIPESEKDDLFEFLSKPATEQGHSQRDLFVMGQGEESISDEGRLLVDYIIYNLKKHGIEGLGGIINRQASTKNAKTLRERFQNQGGSGPNGQQDPSAGSSGGDAQDIPDLNRVLSNA